MIGNRQGVEAFPGGGIDELRGGIPDEILGVFPRMGMEIDLEFFS